MRRLALSASAVNLAVGVLLVRVGKRHHSIVLEADGRHLLTDVWTSVAIVAGLVIVWLSGIHVLDPVIAILVGANIVFTGVRLIYRSFNGLMDHALEPAQLDALRQAIRTHSPTGTDFHALRTRQAGAAQVRGLSFARTGRDDRGDGHDLAERVEAALRAAVPGVEVTIHIEPIEEQASFEDNTLKGIEPP